MFKWPWRPCRPSARADALQCHSSGDPRRGHEALTWVRDLIRNGAPFWLFVAAHKRGDTFNSGNTSEDTGAEFDRARLHSATALATSTAAATRRAAAPAITWPAITWPAIIWLAGTLLLARPRARLESFGSESGSAAPLHSDRSRTSSD